MTGPNEPKAQQEETSVIEEVGEIGADVGIEVVAEGAIDTAGEAATDILGGIFDAIS